MHVSDILSDIDESNKFLVARIDAQDESSGIPIRKYLETHGVKVIVNKTPNTAPTYHIVLGDHVFVNTIFSRTPHHQEKRLGVIQDFMHDDVDISSSDAKYILLDPKELTDQLVFEIFEFFFVSEQHYKDMRTSVNRRIIREPIKKIPETNVSSSDQERIGSIIADVYGEYTPTKPKNTEERRRRHRKHRRQWLIGLTIVFGMFLFPVVWYGCSVLISGITLATSAQSLSTGDLSSSGWKLEVSDNWIKQAKTALGVMSIPLSWIGQNNSIRGQERLLSFITDTIRAQKDVRSMMYTGQSVASGLLNQMNVNSTGTTPAADITSLRSSLASVENTLGLAQAELTILLRDRTFPFSVQYVSTYGEQAVQELLTLRDAVTHMDQLLSLFIQLSGFTQPRTYLILLQNSTELRPTGGFIGSVAVATFDNGRLTNLQVQDVYTFDGQLKGHVDPPLPIRALLAQEHWYLRDSNWDPDFAISADKAAWFYQKETGNTVDGVFAINLPFVVNILKATGPVDLSDYNDRITADNFYGKSLYYVQNDFFPGSTQKKDFLGSLSRTLLTKITTGKTTNMPALFRAITTALAGHDFLVRFTDPQLQAAAEHFGWAGRTPSMTGCTGVDGSECSFYPFIAVESNMGMNKVNYFITRSLDRVLTVDQNGGISETDTLHIRNTSRQTLAAPYRVYIRVLLPESSSVFAVTLDGVKIPSRNSSSTPVLPYMEKIAEDTKDSTIGVALDVPAGTEKQLVMTYTKDNVIRFGQHGAIVDLFIQKQPGVDSESVHTTLHYPDAWTVGIEEQISSEVQDFIANRGQLEYNTVLDRDRLIRIRFTK